MGGRGDHAGQWETSLMLAAAEELVSVEELRTANEFIGCGANALESSVEQGEEWSQEIVERLVSLGNDLLELSPR